MAEPDKERVDLEVEADALVRAVRLTAERAFPVLLKLKRAEIRENPQRVHMLEAILGTDSMEGPVHDEIRRVLTAAVYTAIAK